MPSSFGLFRESYDEGSSIAGIKGGTLFLEMRKLLAC